MKNFSVSQIRQDFPILQRRIHNLSLAYLDNGATTQKPQIVLTAMDDYYQNHNANIHRGVHVLAEESTQIYEDSRKIVADFIKAKPEEIVFTRNTSESLNLIAYSWGLDNLKRGDEILVSVMEHHSNIVSWQIIAAKTGAVVKFINIDKEGNLLLTGAGNSLANLLSNKTKIVSLMHISNVLATINPIKEIIETIKKFNPEIICVVDGAQSAPHMPVDVKDLNCDFFAFSAHKMCGPMGVGVLFAKKQLLEKMSPFFGGGDMIAAVSTEGFEVGPIPEKFEAGTPNVAGAYGLATAIKYLQNVGFKNIAKQEKELTTYLIEKLSNFKDITILGPKDLKLRSGLVSFYHQNIHAHDLAQVLDSVGVAVRSGHHCAMPLHKHLGVIASIRASFYFYNIKEEVDRLIEGLQKAVKIFG